MAIYLVTGRLGSGKSLACVGRIQDALREGRRVATNLDLRLEALLPRYARRVSCMRLPDKPSVRDLEALGLGTEEVDESRNGIIVLDELGSWLNARAWADKERQAVIDWLIHSRKRGWDVYFIAQAIGQVDKQVREALVEYVAVCRRLDRMRVPFVGRFFSMLTGGLVSGYMPKLHVAAVRYGTAHDSVIADRWVYLGRDLYRAYDTRQVFSESYSAGVYSYLTPWHLEGWRYADGPWRRVLARVAPGLAAMFRGAPVAQRQPVHPVSDAHRRALELVRKLPADERWRHARRLASITP